MPVAVRDTSRASVREDVSFDSELLFVDILFWANRKISLGVFYTPPNGNINCLLHLQAALDNVLSSPNSEILLAGDLNIPEFHRNTNCPSVDSPYSTLLSDIIQAYTRQFSLSASQGSNSQRKYFRLGVRFVFRPSLWSKSWSALFWPQLDLYAIIGETVPWREIAEVKLFLQGGRLGSSQESFTLHSMALDTDIDRIWAAWSDLFSSAVDECIPKRAARRNANAPWISGNLIKMCRRKKALCKREKTLCSDWLGQIS